MKGVARSMLETPQEILAHDASTDAVRSFIQWRKATKKPLTERAAALIAKSLREITGAGGDADEALDLAQEHGWQTIKPHWYWRIKDDANRNDPTACVGDRSRNPGIGRGTVDAFASVAEKLARGGSISTDLD